MSLKVGNCTVAYLRVLITDPIIDKPIIVQLAAKIGNASHLSWLKPSSGNLKGTIAEENGLKLHRKGNLLLNGYVVRTKKPGHVLKDLYWLMDQQKPILLITYSTQRETELFIETIRKNNYGTQFGRVIEGVVNTLSIFQKKYPELDWEGGVDLPILAQRALKRDCSMGYFDTSRHLELLEELVSGSELRFELNKNSQSWREFFPDLLCAPKNPLINAPISDLLREIIEANEENEDHPIEKQPAWDLDPESGGLLVEELVPVQQFRDRQNSDEQLLINQDRRPNTPDSFAAQQQEITRNNRRRNNDFAFGSEPGDLNPQSRSRVEEQGLQFPDWQNLDEQLLISQDRRRITSDSFATQQQKITHTASKNPLMRAPTSDLLNEIIEVNEEIAARPNEYDPFEEEVPVQQFRDRQNSDEQLLINQNRRRNTSDSFATQQRKITHTASKNPLMRAPTSDLLNEIIKINEEIAARPNEYDPFEEEVPVQQFRDRQNSDEQLLINQNRRRNTSDSFATQQRKITHTASKNPLMRAPTSDLLNEIIKINEEIAARPNEYDPFEEEVPVQQFRDRQNSDEQLLINQNRRRNTSDSFATQQRKITHTASKNPLMRAPTSDLLNEIIEVNEEIAARPNEYDPFEEEVPVQQFRDRQNSDEQLLINQNRRRNTSDSFATQQRKITHTASKNPLMRAPTSDLLNEIIEVNEEIAARPNEYDPFEEEVPVQQFRDRQNSDEQLLINQNRRRNTSDSFATQQQEITRKHRRRNNDVAFGKAPGDLNPESGSLVEEQGQQFRDWQDSDDQLPINQDRRRTMSDSFAAKQQAIPRKIRRPNNDVAFGREPADLNTESGLLVEEQGPQFPDWQNSDDQLPTNQDQSDKYDRFSALGEHIPEEIHEFVGEYEALRDNDDTFQRVPLPRPPYLPNQVNLPPVNPNQRGRDWIRDWNQEYNYFSGKNDHFFP